MSIYCAVNCFEEELPPSLCIARQVEVLSLNGLRAAEGCADSVVLPLSGVGLFNTIGGTVPACVWALRNLSVLHLTGNGLSGELIRSLPANSQIVDLSLSHNQLSGTIPLDILNIASLVLQPAGWRIWRPDTSPAWLEYQLGSQSPLGTTAYVWAGGCVKWQSEYIARQLVCVQQYSAER